MSTKIIKAIASPMTGCPAWTIAVFKAEDVPEGTEVAPVQAQEPVAAAISYWKGPTNSNGTPRECGDANIGRWLDYEPTTLKHGMAIKDRGDPDKRVKFLFDAAPVQPVALPDGLRKAFVTLESCDARYSIVMKFNQKTDAFAAHDFLLGVGGKDYNSAAPAAQGDATQAEIDVLNERRRQKEVEGWTAEHDDKYAESQLSSAAACYALHTEPVGNVGDYHRFWPWISKWWKPADRRRNMVKAGALILAEIERIDRAAIAAKAAS